MIQRSILYYVTKKEGLDSSTTLRFAQNDETGGEFLKIQPGTGDNLSAEDIAAGFTDYVIWNRFRSMDLDIDGELEMECVDSGMVLLKRDSASIASAQPRNDILEKVLEFAYGSRDVKATLLLRD